VVFDMSDTKKSSGSGGKKSGTRNLPSWMSSRENDSKSGGKKPTEDSEGEESNEGEKPKEAKGRGRGGKGSTPSKESENRENDSVSGLPATNFSKLLVID
jgi:hypothetical protein